MVELTVHVDGVVGGSSSHEFTMFGPFVELSWINVLVTGLGIEVS